VRIRFPRIPFPALELVRAAWRLGFEPMEGGFRLFLEKRRCTGGVDGPTDGLRLSMFDHGNCSELFDPLRAAAVSLSPVSSSDSPPPIHLVAAETPTEYETKSHCCQKGGGEVSLLLTTLDDNDAIQKRPFPCHKCPARFTQKSTLNRHVRHVHDGIKAHRCTHCDAVFSQRSSMEKHVKVIHERVKEFCCPYCNSLFGQSGDLNIHVRTVHLKERP